jgi:nitrous oxidase accessory protein
MGDRLFRKGLVLGIILLFIGSNVASGFNIQLKNTTYHLITGRGNTLYVGGSGTGNYTKIQDAIDAAVDGDTVFVYDDSSPYYETLEIRKLIDLIGEYKNTTVIDGKNAELYHDILTIHVDKVKVSGFTFQNATKDSRAHFIEIHTHENIITDNIFINSLYALVIYGSSNTIRNNVITKSLNSGIETIYSSSFNIISNNIITNNGEDGIYGGGTKNTFSENYIANNSHYGILNFGTESTISENYIENNENGICVGGDSSTVVSNFVTNNKDFGIILDGTDSSKVKNNIVINNKYGGITLDDSDWNIINNNTIINNGIRGIYLRCYDLWDYNHCVRYSSNNNDIYGNIISGHEYGFRVLFDCTSNKIYRNKIVGNEIGVFIDVSNANKVLENNFINNTKNACFRTFRNYALYFDKNYWDDWPFSETPKKISGTKALILINYIWILYYKVYCFFVPCSIYDYHPVNEPYDIGV